MRKLKNYINEKSALNLKTVAVKINLAARRQIEKRKLKTFSKISQIGVTYANNLHTDGAGAQIQRILGIFAISRLLSISYIHSPLLTIDYQGLSALEGNFSNPAVVATYNDLFNIPSDMKLPGDYTIRDFRNVTISELASLNEEAVRRNEFVLARILYPYGIMDKFPEGYHAAKDLSPFRKPERSDIRVAIHVRRGELVFVESHRMLPNEYYISVARKIAGILEGMGRNYCLELYTELPSMPFRVTPNHEGVKGRISEDVIVTPEQNKIHDFDCLPNLKKYINTDPIDTLRKMATADIFVMSHSSFSYLAAILNQNGTILYNNFWHSPQKSWLKTNEKGEFSAKKFVATVKKSIFHEKYSKVPQ